MRIVFWSVIGALIAAQIVAYIVWHIALQSPQKWHEDDHRLANSDQMAPFAERVHKMIDEQNAIPFEPVSVQSDDGLTLVGRYYHHAEGAPLVILMHGYRGTPIRDFSGGIQLYRDAGYNILLIVERAHLNSGGRSITMGVKERYDCLKWIAWGRERLGEDVPIVLAGISMGAATVLMAAGLSLPSDVCAIVADAPYTTPKAIFLSELKNRHLPPKFAYFFLTIGAWLFGGFRLNDPTADAAACAKRSPVPILLIHGEDDRFVPCDMGRAITAAAPDKVELHTFPNAGHGLSYLVDTPRYTKIVQDFLDRTVLHRQKI